MSDDKLPSTPRDHHTKIAFLTDEADRALAAGDREHCVEIVAKLYQLHDTRMCIPSRQIELPAD